MPDLEISKLPELLGPGLAPSDVVAIADLSASETKKLTAKNLVQAGVALIDDATIPYSKIDAPDVNIPDGSVTTEMLQDGAVTDDKIANVDGSKINAGSITGDKFGDVVDRGLDITLDKIGITNSVVPGESAGISWDAQGLITGALPTIPPDDLPVATTTTVGVVSVPTTGGLAVSGTGEIEIAYTTTPNIVANISYNEFGQIVYVTEIEPGHLPVATNDTVGAAQFPSNGGLLVDGNGNVTLSETGVVGGQYTKVTVDVQGRVTNGALLESVDIPPLSADKIQSGEFPTARLADGSVTAPKLADYSTCLMQEDNPGEGSYLGQLWYTPSTAQLRVYARGSAGNQWNPVGFGALQANNLRWGGTYDASTDKLAVLTAIGTSAGLSSGDPFPAPTDALSGMYFICQTPGSSMAQPNLNGISHTQGDWALCVDESQGWVHVDMNAGGGGGGGSAQYLNDLLDVEIGGTSSPFDTAPAQTLSGDQILRYDGSGGKWRNTNIIDGGSID